jgi:hypothetical protein
LHIVPGAPQQCSQERRSAVLVKIDSHRDEAEPVPLELES